jgi:hypothetical protein
MAQQVVQSVDEITIVDDFVEYVLGYKPESKGMQQWWATTAPAPFQLRPEEARAKALAYVNVARAALGMSALEQLPKGYVKNANECVLARALGACKVAGGIAFAKREQEETVAAVWATGRGPHGVAVQQALQAFVSFFDSGLYPDLVS